MDNVVISAATSLSQNTAAETFKLRMNFGKVGWIFNDKVTYEAVGRALSSTPFDVTKLSQARPKSASSQPRRRRGYQAEALVKAG